MKSDMRDGGSEQKARSTRCVLPETIVGESVKDAFKDESLSAIAGTTIESIVVLFCLLNIVLLRTTVAPHFLQVLDVNAHECEYSSTVVTSPKFTLRIGR